MRKTPCLQSSRTPQCLATSTYLLQPPSSSSTSFSQPGLPSRTFSGAFRKRQTIRQCEKSLARIEDSAFSEIYSERTRLTYLMLLTNSLDVSCSIIVDDHSRHLFDPGGSMHNKALVRLDTTSELDSKLIHGIGLGYKSNPPRAASDSSDWVRSIELQVLTELHMRSFQISIELETRSWPIVDRLQPSTTVPRLRQLPSSPTPPASRQAKPTFNPAG